MLQPMAATLDRSTNNDFEEDRSINTNDIETQADATTKAQPKLKKHKYSVNSSNIKGVLFLGFSSLGAIYGDIGTSPLYVLNSIFPNGPPSNKDVLGAMSCIFWIFTLVVICKYCFIVLYFGPNNNEGGQIAIYAKIASHLSIGPKGVTINNSGDLLSFTRSETHDSFNIDEQNGIENHGGDKKLKTILQKLKLRNGRYNKTLVNKYLSTIIMGLCFLGCGLVISDGLLTPTTSVLSAIDGIAVAAPSFETKVLPVSCAVLLLLFLIQGFGSGKLSLFFAPIIFVWLLMLFITGLINIIKHDPAVFRSLNPKEAIDFLKRYGNVDKFGAVMLCVTGTEAMFADIGHFSRLSIQLTLSCFVFPCLMIQYLGQSAYLMKHPEGITNVFYLCIPGGTNTGLYWFMFVLATLATVIASQALILGVFSILRQLIHLDCFPNFKVRHMSSKHFGQVYIPVVNYILMVAVICTCVGFKTSSNVTAAYGLGVAMDFVVTSFLITTCLLYVYKINILVALGFLCFFGALEMCLVVAGLRKVPQGAWFTLMVTMLVFAFISFWRWCRSKKINQEYADRSRIKNILLSAKLVSDNKNRSNDKGVVLQFDSHDLLLNSTSGTGGTGNANGTISNNDQYSSELTEVKTNYVDPFYKVNYHQTTQYDLIRYQGIGIMYTNIIHTLNSANTVPKLFEQLITSFPALPTKFIFLSIRVTSDPYVKQKDHIMIEKLKAASHAGLYRCVVKFGFMDKIQMTNHTIMDILECIELEEYDEEVNAANKYQKFDSMPINGDIDDDELDDGEYSADEDEIRNWKVKGNPVELKTRVLHIVDNSIIKAKSYNAEYLQDKNKVTRAWIRCKYFVRSFLVEQIFVPINNLFGGFEKALHLDDNNELVFIGKSVTI